MHNGHYYFDKMPKEVQEEFKKSYRITAGTSCTLEEYLNNIYSSHDEFINESFFWNYSPQGEAYWIKISKEYYSDIKSASLYTASDLVKFGNYLLSDARRESIMSNPETSPEAKEEILKQVTDADISNWENLKL